MLVSPHKAVLLDEVLAIFKNSEVLLDATLGFSGHAKALLAANLALKLIGSDKDEYALNFSKEYLKEYLQRISLIKAGFKDILDLIDINKINAILLDLGLSSYQLDTNERGFGINCDFLDMRMDLDKKLNASIIINEYSKEELERIFKEYGQLSRADFLAQKIIKARALAKISKASELAKIIGFKKEKNRKISELILCFQALRIEVNDELKELELFLQKLEKLAKNKLKIAIISFHSLEDRLVKRAFKKWSKNCLCDELALRCTCGGKNARGKILNKKPIIASKEELIKNPRAKSAKLRAFEFIKKG